jgi:hypothetical protein
VQTNYWRLIFRISAQPSQQVAEPLINIIHGKLLSEATVKDWRTLIACSDMPYHNAIKQEAQYVQALGQGATEDCLYATYMAVLTEWFPTSRGYMIDDQGFDRGGCFVVRHAAQLEKKNPVLVVELKQPSKFNDTGKLEVMMDLTEYIEGRFDLTQYNMIYGLGGIGLDWKVCKMARTAPYILTTVQTWTADITSDDSYDAFGYIANLVYNIS